MALPAYAHHSFPAEYDAAIICTHTGGVTPRTRPHRIEYAGATVINTGIGWHEARVPTIITQVPRGAWTWTTQRLKAEAGQRDRDNCLRGRRVNLPTSLKCLCGARTVRSAASRFVRRPFVTRA